MIYKLIIKIQQISSKGRICRNLKFSFLKVSDPIWWVHSSGGWFVWQYKGEYVEKKLNHCRRSKRFILNRASYIFLGTEAEIQLFFVKTIIYWNIMNLSIYKWLCTWTFFAQQFYAMYNIIHQRVRSWKVSSLSLEAYGLLYVLYVCFKYIIHLCAEDELLLFAVAATFIFQNENAELRKYKNKEKIRGKTVLRK